MKRLVVVAALLGALPALADEGMWTYNNFPSDAGEGRSTASSPTQEWLDHVRLVVRARSPAAARPASSRRTAW